MKLLVTMLVLAAVEGPAVAQSDVDQESEAGEAPEPFVHGLLATSGFYYGESASRVVDENDQASPVSLAFADLRARVDAGNLAGSRWGGLGDFRLRITRDELSARGYDGGGEAHLREAFAIRRGERVNLSFGRQIVREVDATRVDGMQLRYHPGGAWEYGAFGGLYPDPMSRTLETDYAAAEGGLHTPVAGGGLAAYNSPRNHGGFGLGVVSPRDADLVDPEPARVFATSNGYHLLGEDLDLFHTLVVDATGRAGAELSSALVGASWRPFERLRIEAGASHMSTRAVEIYVRDLLEKPDPDPEAGAPVQNNLTLVRIGNDEGRLGGNLSLPRRFDVWSQVRLRRRATLTDAELPMEIAGLEPDRQIDVSGGVRQRDSLLGLDLTASGVVIRGDRTASSFGTLRIRRDFLAGRVSPEAEATYILYADRCGADDPTCTGTLEGRTFRTGGTLAVLAPDRWLFLTDYRFARNRAEREGMAQPTIDSHTVFARVQRSF